MAKGVDLAARVYFRPATARFDPGTGLIHVHAETVDGRRTYTILTAHAAEGTLRAVQSALDQWRARNGGVRKLG